ncbi:MAG: WD40 repeat domain-containing protein [Acidobacteriaceae bacterium]
MLTLAGLGGFAANAQTSDSPRLVAQLASGQVIACAYSPDGRSALTGGREGKARLWDAATGEELQFFQGEAWITHVAVSSDNRNVLTVSVLDQKTAVQLWDKASGKELGRISQPAGNLLFGLDSADGSTITTANWVEKDDQGNKLPAGGAKIQMWNVMTGKELSHFLVPGAGAVGMLTVVSPNGRNLFSGDGNGPAVWDVETGKLLLRLGNNDGVVSAAAFSADGSKVAWGTIPGVVQLWDLGAGKQMQRFAADDPSKFIGSVQSVSISPDGSRVLVASNDDDARLWDVATGKQIALFQASDDRVNAAVNCAAISPDGSQVLTAADDQTARLWNVQSGKELRRLIGEADQVAALAFVDGGLGIVEVSGTGMAWLWDAKSGEAQLRPMMSSKGNPPPAASTPGGAAAPPPVSSTAAGSYLSPVVLSPDGRRLFLAGFQGEQGVWDVATGKEIQSFPPPNLAFAAVDFSPDGSKLLSANHGPTFSLWDVGTGKEIQHFTVDPGWRPSFLYPEGDFRDGVEHLALSPDGHEALTSDSEGSTRLWNVDTGKQVRVIKVNTLEDLAVGFSPDSRKLITENSDGSATLRDAKSGKDLQHFDKASAPSFSADGHRVLMGGSVWNVDTGKELQSFGVPSGSEPTWTLSADGNKVLMGTQDGATTLWDAGTGKELATLYCLRDGTWAVVDPDNRFDTGNIDAMVALHWVNDGDPVRLSPLAAFKDGHYTPGLLKYILSGQQLPPVQSTAAASL